MNYIIDKEVWKPVTLEGYEHYLVSKNGEVKNTRTGHILTPVFHRDKYLMITLANRGKQSTQFIHRLVALSWIPNFEEKRTVNHKDGNKLNNNVENLEWMSTEDNIQHAFDTGINVYHRPNLMKSKKKIQDMLLEGMTYEDISKEFNCTWSTIKRFSIEHQMKRNHYTTRMTLTSEDVRKAYKYLLVGESLRSIGRKFNTSHSTITNCLNKYYGKDHIDSIKLK